MTTIHVRHIRALFLSALIATPGMAQDALLAPGSTWSYLDDGTDQGTAWSQPGYDDSGWVSGAAQLGYGDGDEATVVSYGPSSSNKYITTYFRSTFDLPDPTVYGSLAIRLLRDDGAVVYLNGTEVVRSNMPAGTITSGTLASSAMSSPEESNFYWTSVDMALLVPGANLVAVEVHQVSATSSDISLDLELRAGTSETLVSRGPYLQRASATALVVRWRTVTAIDSRVWIGDSPSTLVPWVDGSGVGVRHEVEVAGLQPATTYYYAVGTLGGILAGGDAAHSFRTPPVTGSDEPVRLWVIGDSGTADSNAAAVRDAYAALPGAEATNLWLMLGDNAYYDGNGAQYQVAVFDMYPSMLRRSVLWPTRGNHDTQQNTYYNLFTMPTAGEAGGVPSGTEAYYSFDYANVHFVCLDSEGSGRAVGGAMWLWLESDLAATTQDWIIAFWHHPPYSKGSHNSDTESTLIDMRSNFLPLLEDYGVDLVLNGHSHSIERSFLLDGHYGASRTLTSSMVKDSGDGREDGDGAYNRAAGVHVGAVYCVAGSSGKTSSGPLNHPVMYYSASILGSLVIDVDGGRMDVRFLRSTGAVSDHFTLIDSSHTGTYCRAAPHSGGCEASIAFSGVPSASSTSPFLITCADVLTGQFGILFYGYAPDRTPFSAGHRCVANPVVRTPPQSSGTGGPCDGTFQLEFNTLIQGGHHAGLVPGATVYAQYWFRDPSSGPGTGLSDGVQFVIEP
jgi:hypothetical protein